MSKTNHTMIPPSMGFRQEREGTWRELEAIIVKAEKRKLSSLSARELSRLPLLYRAALASLAVARNSSLNRNQNAYLENLCARAHIVLTGSRPRVREAIKEFLVRGFPRAVRRVRWHLLASALLMVLGAATAYAATAANPERYYNFVDEEYSQGRNPSASTEDLRAVLYGGGDPDSLAEFTGMLLSNNARIGLLCFALGFALGIPVIYLLFTNGAVVGAFAALYGSRGLGVEFWGWILPHGVTELLAVILCGAAGLAMAQSFLFPGRLSRMVSLTKVTRQAGMVVIGAVAMFFLAAFIEGFFRQLVHDTTIRYTVALSSALLWTVYLTWGGRRPGPSERAALPAPAEEDA